MRPPPPVPPRTVEESKVDNAKPAAESELSLKLEDEAIIDETYIKHPYTYQKKIV
jgi:hypothetical protein